METGEKSDLQGETDVPYVPNIRPVIVPRRIGSNAVNLSGDLEAPIKTTEEADAEKRTKRKPRPAGTARDTNRKRFGSKK